MSSVRSLHRGDDLTLEEQETNDVSRRAIELGSDVLGRRTTLDDDVTLGDRRRLTAAR